MYDLWGATQLKLLGARLTSYIFSARIGVTAVSGEEDGNDGSAELRSGAAWTLGFRWAQSSKNGTWGFGGYPFPGIWAKLGQGFFWPVDPSSVLHPDTRSACMQTCA